MRIIKESGISLIEILIVITIFAVLGIIISQSVILSLRGSKKSETLVTVRENVDYAVGIMERQLRNANSIPDCEGAGPSELVYIDRAGKETRFTCVSGAAGYIASGSASIRLTTDKVAIKFCAMTCTPGTASNPSYIDINLIAESANVTGAESSTVTTKTRIYLRNY